MTKSPTFSPEKQGRLFAILDPFLDVGLNADSSVRVTTEGKAEIDLDPVWMVRTIVVGLAKQARANLRAGRGPNGDALPPLKVSRLQVSRGGKKLVHAQRGIDTGLLLRSIVSAVSDAGNGVVYVTGPRGERVGGDESAAESVFLDTFAGNLEQPHVQVALQKVADAIVAAIDPEEALAAFTDEAGALVETLATVGD